MENVYDVGDVVRVSSTFTNSNTGLLIDPSAVFLAYKAPGTEAVVLTYGVDAALIRDSEGIYHVDVDLTTAGKWLYRWYTTGIGKTAEQNSFIARKSSI